MKIDGPKLNGHTQQEGAPQHENTYTLKDLSLRFEVEDEFIRGIIEEGKVYDVPQLKDRYSQTEAEEIYCAVLDEEEPATFRRL